MKLDRIYYPLNIMQGDSLTDKKGNIILRFKQDNRFINKQELNRYIEVNYIQYENSTHMSKM